MAPLEHSNCSDECSLMAVISTGRRNTLFEREKINYRPISQSFRGGTRAAEKITLWDSCLRREFAESVWASVWQAVIVIYCQLAPCCVDRLRSPPISDMVASMDTPTPDHKLG